MLRSVNNRLYTLLQIFRRNLRDKFVCLRAISQVSFCHLRHLSRFQGKMEHFRGTVFLKDLTQTRMDNIHEIRRLRGDHSEPIHLGKAEDLVSQTANRGSVIRPDQDQISLRNEGKTVIATPVERLRVENFRRNCVLYLV